MDSYIGIPENISESKCKQFDFFKGRLQNIVNGQTGGDGYHKVKKKC